METIIVEFLLGVLAGTVSGLVVVARRSRSPLQAPKGVEVVRQSRSKTGPAYRRAAKPRIDRTRRPNHIHRRRAVQPSNPISSPSTKESAPTDSLSSCPGCGLQAPETLLDEHFLGSPSHRNKPADPAPIVTSTDPDRTTNVSELDSRDSLRSLLQILVPPRAFGRRHGQRTVDPLANLVQNIDRSGITPAR